MNDTTQKSTQALKPSSPLKWCLKIGLPVVITVAFVIYIYNKIDNPGEIWEEMKRASLLPLILLLPISLVSHLLRAWRWRRFIGEPVSLFYSFSSVMIGYAVNDILPRVGEVARVVNMNRMTRVPIARLATTLLAERILDVLMLVLLLGLSLAIEGEAIAQLFPRLAQAGPKFTFIALIGLVGLFAVAHAPELFCRFFGGLFGKLHRGLGEKLQELIRQGADGLAFLKKPVQTFWILLETVGIWAIYLAGFLLGLDAFGILETTGFPGGTVVFSVTCAGVLVPAVGAIGPYHDFGKEAMTQLYQVDPSLAWACIIVIHAILFYVVGGVLGVLVWGLQGWIRKRSSTPKK